MQPTLDRTIIYDSEVRHFQHLSYLLVLLSKSIDTPLLPTRFDGEREFIYESLRIQESRSFAEGFPEACLCLSVDNHRTLLSYQSTSGSEVEVSIGRTEGFGGSCKIHLTVTLPAHRAEPGRVAYEAITRALYCKEDWVQMPKPEWVLDQKYLENLDIKQTMVDLGFGKKEVAGFSYWENLEGCTIVVSEDGLFELRDPGGRKLARRNRLEVMNADFIGEQIARLDEIDAKEAEYEEYEEDQEAEYEEYEEDPAITNPNP